MADSVRLKNIKKVVDEKIETVSAAKKSPEANNFVESPQATEQAAPATTEKKKLVFHRQLDEHLSKGWNRKKNDEPKLELKEEFKPCVLENKPQVKEDTKKAKKQEVPKSPMVTINASGDNAVPVSEKPTKKTWKNPFSWFANLGSKKPTCSTCHRKKTSSNMFYCVTCDKNMYCPRCMLLGHRLHEIRDVANDKSLQDGVEKLVDKPAPISMVELTPVHQHKTSPSVH